MVSYGIFTVLLFVAVAGLLIIVINPMINESVDIVNPEISDGAVSTKYVTYFNLSAGLAKALPIFVLLGVAAWAIVRALEKRNQGDF